MNYEGELEECEGDFYATLTSVTVFNNSRAYSIVFIAIDLNSPAFPFSVKTSGKNERELFCCSYLYIFYLSLTLQSIFTGNLILFTF